MATAYMNRLEKAAGKKGELLPGMPKPERPSRGELPLEAFKDTFTAQILFADDDNTCLSQACEAIMTGLIEKNENYREAAVREMKEETGLTFTPLDVDPMYERAFYNSVGMTDESCNLVYGYCEGTVSRDGLEDSEELDVVLADREEARRILREERVAANCAYMLMQFIHDEDDPFSFLQG